MHCNVAIQIHLPPTSLYAQKTCPTTVDHEFRNQPIQVSWPMRFTFRASSLILSHPPATGILTCQMSPFDLENLTVPVPSQGKRRGPFSTQNLQATLDRHSNLTGLFIHFQMDIFCQLYSLTTCHFIFVLYATHMSWDDLFFTSSPPLPKSSIQATTF
jgi:hypothetical protein